MLRWNNPKSEYSKNRREEDRELTRKEKTVVGWSRWDLACLGVGGEKLLIKEIQLNKLMKLSRYREVLLIKISNIPKDPTGLYKKRKEYVDLLEETRNKYTVHFEDGHTYLYSSRFTCEMEKIREKMEWFSTYRSIEEYEKLDYYKAQLELIDKKLEEFTGELEV